jgi:hypothetical protein
MLAMQAFYERLIQATNQKDPYYSRLAMLTRMCLKQMDWLKSELAWYPWDAGAK